MGRAAHRFPHPGDRLAVDPGLRASGIGADRIITVQPDGHAQIPRQTLRREQLLMREPLKVYEELDLDRVFGGEAGRRPTFTSRNSSGQLIHPD